VDKPRARRFGTVFESTAGGTVTPLYSFCSQTGCTDGSYPAAGLVRTNNGNFYGTTTTGGVNACGYNGCGTVFEFTAGRKLITLHTFGGPDGAEPWGTLVQATNGNFYGTTYFGGANDVSTCAGFGPNLVGCGTVFRITPAGKLTTLHSFDFTDGAGPVAVLVQGTNGNLYGTTSYGGTSTACSVSVGCGTVFEITLQGKLTTLHNFDGTDGASPVGLAQATNGNLYGATESGGTSTTTCNGSCGTVFEITPEGKLTTLHRFDYTDGWGPGSTLLQATNGALYGTTVYGGDYGVGTVFSLGVGLGPFVETLPTLGAVGAAVIILGNNLTGTTSVTFNGTAATFKVKSNSEITTTVPNGATTGKIRVITPSRTLSSNLNFRVTPTISGFSPASGPVGTSVVITGHSFTQATSVTFGGVKSASFTVNSDTQITATVPTGAKTGKIAVTTSGGTATSSATFTVTT
jgi:uncharacterized repeat protein (TIGR03803 family)